VTTIAIIGLWHQGVVAAACLTELGFTVIAADADAVRIEALREGRAPLFEPGLD
jgi:UDPglucose 6-dehydrogenase